MVASLVVAKCDTLACNGRCGNADSLLIICKLDGFWSQMMNVLDCLLIDADLTAVSKFSL
jgi:hypothetical protein